MACSSQLVNNAESYYEKNKAAVDEMMKCTKAILTQNPQLNVSTAGQISNMTKCSLFFFASMNWCGNVIKPYPQVINDLGHFLHGSNNGLIGQSDVGAVVYTIGKSNLGWLLAWSVTPSEDAPNKIYMEVGPVENLTKWDEVKEKLEASESTKIIYTDSNGNEMYASISPNNPAQLVAIYKKQEH